MIYSVLQSLADEYDSGEDIDNWKRMVSLKFDACHISDRVLFNFYTDELVGFTEDAFGIDILASEFKLIGSVDNADKND